MLYNLACTLLERHRFVSILRIQTLARLTAATAVIGCAIIGDFDSAHAARQLRSQAFDI
jgi:hypothetical protein